MANRNGVFRKSVRVAAKEMFANILASRNAKSHNGVFAAGHPCIDTAAGAMAVRLTIDEQAVLVRCQFEDPRLANAVINGKNGASRQPMFNPHTGKFTTSISADGRSHLSDGEILEEIRIMIGHHLDLYGHANQAQAA